MIHKQNVLELKAADGQTVTGGSILYRQRGTHIYPGVNVGRGGDDTLFVKVEGVVRFERKGRDKNKFLFTQSQNKRFSKPFVPSLDPKVRKLEIAKLKLLIYQKAFFFYLFKNIMFTLVNIMFEFVFLKNIV